MKKKLSNLAAVFALALTIVSVNRTCIFILHQEEVPDQAKKLRRF